MTIGVVTVLFNSSTVLDGFFASLAAQNMKDFHVWAIDNASTDNSVALCQAQKERFSVIANATNIGVAAANNQGIHAALDAGCDYVLLLNNDVEFGPALFEQLLAGMTSCNCQITAPIMYYFDRPRIIWAAGGKYQPLFGYRCYHLFDGVEDTGQFKSPYRAEHAPTCCVLFARSVFETVGFMDERYFVYHDDTDFMLRCWRAGLRLYILPNATLLHKVSTLTGGGESEFSIRFGTRNRIYMITKFFGRLLAAPYFISLAGIYFLRRLLGQDTPEKYAIKQKSLRQGYLMGMNWLPLTSKRK